MGGDRRVKIEALPESVYRLSEYDAIVCIDVMLASTTVVTSLAQGRRTLLAATLDHAVEVCAALVDPVLALEDTDEPQAGFDCVVGPAALSRRSDVEHPLVLVSPWVQFLVNSNGGPVMYVASLRNVSATAESLSARHDRVALLCAGYSGQHRCEDQMAAAWIGRKLVERGFETADPGTADEIARWSRVDVSVAGLGKGAEYLRRLGQQEELDFVMTRVDDLELVACWRDGEVVPALTAIAPVRAKNAARPAPAHALGSPALAPLGLA